MDILKHPLSIKSLIFFKWNCHAKMAPDNGGRREYARRQELSALPSRGPRDREKLRRGAKPQEPGARVRSGNMKLRWRAGISLCRLAMSMMTEAPKFAATRPTASWVAFDVKERTVMKARAGAKHHFGLELTSIYSFRAGQHGRVRAQFARL